jgi:tRNA(fMet)-specific endonuclease VapC
MAGDYLIDTNIAIAFLSGERVVIDRILNANMTCISVVTFGELAYGACYSKQLSKNLDQADQLLRWAILLDIKHDISVIYGTVKSDLRKMGRPIPDNDLWIAATAKRHGLTLASRDGHFSAVLDLQVESW